MDLHSSQLPYGRGHTVVQQSSGWESMQAMVTIFQIIWAIS